MQEVICIRCEREETSGEILFHLNQDPNIYVEELPGANININELLSESWKVTSVNSKKITKTTRMKGYGPIDFNDPNSPSEEYTYSCQKDINYTDWYLTREY